MSSTIDNISIEIKLPENCDVNVKTMLEYFCEGEDAVYLLQNLDSVQIMELLSILFEEINIHPEYGIPLIKPVYYDDSDDIAYIKVIFDSCNRVEWKNLEMEFLSKESSIKGRVAVTCIQGLIE
jgi:hypothetical protein